MNKYRFWLLLIILIALALRLHNLTYHSLWFDEAISVHWARQSVPRILEVGLTLVEDRLPPLYYLMLKGWTWLFGFGEVGVRSLSVWFGVLLIPVLARLSAHLFNRRVALLATLLAALNPFLIWYAQEARMYAPAVCFSTLAVWTFLRMNEPAKRQTHRAGIIKDESTDDASRHTPRTAQQGETSPLSTPPSPLLTPHLTPSILFILAAIAGLYSHLYTGFLLPALGLWLLISYRRAWRLWLRFALSGLIITIAFAPLAVATWRFSGEAIPGDPLSGLGRRAWQLWQAFTVWKAPLPPALRIAIPATIACFALTAYLNPVFHKFTAKRLGRSRGFSRSESGKTRLIPQGGFAQPRLLRAETPERASRSSLPAPRSPLLAPPSPLPHPLLLLTLLLLSPFVIANLLLFRNHLAFFGERYFIVMVPWLLLLAAVGADKLRQRMANERTANERTHRAGVANERTTNERIDSASVAKEQWENPANPHQDQGAPPPLTGIESPRRTPHSPLPAPRLLGYLPVALLLIATVLPIPGQWSIPAAKEAWRQSVAYLARVATPDDGILIHPDWVRFPFQFYFRGPGQTYAAFSNVTPETPLDGPLQGVVSDHPVIWLIQSHLDGPDPDRLVERWFNTRYPLVTELYPPGIILKGYATTYRLENLPPAATPADIRFDNGLHLIGYQADRTAAAADPLFHPPSGWVHVILYWTATQPLTVVASPVVHLVGPEGVWGISLERPNDALKLHSSWQWPAEAQIIIRHDVDVNLNPITPPGRYQLLLGLPGYETQYPLAEVEIR